MTMKKVGIAALLIALAAGLLIGTSGRAAALFAQRDIVSGPAHVFLDNSCNGESMEAIGTTTDLYSAVRNRAVVSASFTGSALGSAGNTYEIFLFGLGVFGQPTGHDGQGDFHDIHYFGFGLGPAGLSFSITGTWRVWVNNGEVVTDAILTLETTCLGGDGGGPDED
jgi:hypothetical protein